MAITSSNQILKYDLVEQACNLIREGAEYYGLAASDVDQARQYCSGNNLSVDGKDMSEGFDEVKNALSNPSNKTGVKENIEEFCDSILEAAKTIIANQQAELDAYNKAQQAATQNNNQ